MRCAALVVVGMLNLVLQRTVSAEEPGSEYPGLFDDLSQGYLVEKYPLGESAWQLTGTSKMSPDMADLQITSGTAGAKGQSWVQQRISATSWEVRFWVDVVGDMEKPGKGMAFWYTKNLESTGILYGSNEKFDGVVSPPPPPPSPSPPSLK